MDIVFTNGNDSRFIKLCHELDDFLNEIAGGEKKREQYIQYNTLEDIHDVILLMDQNKAVGCGSFKKYQSGVAEIKRVFVKKEYRNHGLGRIIMDYLEKKAKENGYTKLILETGKPLKAAMQLYETIGFIITKNFGQYENMPDSICMEKIL